MKPYCLKFGLITCSMFFSTYLQAQSKQFQIVIMPDDSLYKWQAKTPTGIREFSVEKATVINFNNNDKIITSVQSVCGRGVCGDGIEIHYFANGMMESKGSYGYTTDIDSLKETERDGFLDYVGKNGWWYYWNENGFLIKKENWLKDKLIQTVHYTTTIQSTRKK